MLMVALTGCILAGGSLWAAEMVGVKPPIPSVWWIAHFGALVALVDAAYFYVCM
jgi:hypothetical protein